MPQAPFSINPALTAIAIDYADINARNRGYIADQVFPRVRVDAPEFKYTTYPIEEAFEVLDTQAGRRGSLNEFALTAAEAAGFVLDYGLKFAVPYRDELAARALTLPTSIKARHAKSLVDKVQLAREVRVSGIAFSASNYQTGYKATLSGTGQWSDFTNSDPVATILDAKAGMLVAPNVAVMGEPVFRMLRRHPKVSTALGGSAETGRYASEQELASILGFSRLIVGNTIQQTSKKGQTLATAPVWGKHFAMLNVGGEAGDDPSFGYTFQWGDRVAGGWADPDIGLHGGEWVKYGESIREQVVAPYAGYLFTNAVA